MKKSIIINLLMLVFNALQAQTEIKAYLGAVDVPGLAIEYSKNNYGLELSGSFRKKEYQTYWLGKRSGIQTLSFINFVGKKYFDSQNKSKGAYIGAYMRLRSQNQSIKDPFDLSPEIKSMLATADYPVTYRTQKDKLSIGGLLGYKWMPNDHFIFETNFGFGYAPYYQETSYNYNAPKNSRPYEGSEFFGNIERISLYGHLMLGYRFGLRNEEINDDKNAL